MSMASRNAFPQGRQWGGKGQLLLDVQRSETTCPPPSDGLPGGRRRLTLLLGSILEVFRGGEGYLCRPARPDVRRHPGRPLRADTADRNEASRAVETRKRGGETRGGRGGAGSKQVLLGTRMPKEEIATKKALIEEIK